MLYEMEHQMHIKRVVVVVLDSVGIGEAPDAAAFGDMGSHTLGNLARVVGGLDVPNLAALGLGNIEPLAGVARIRCREACMASLPKYPRAKTPPPATGS